MPNTVVITGGGSGIGLALAERFAAKGDTVIICGRRRDVLEQIVQTHPGLHARQCDLALAEDRESLATWLATEWPKTNIFINNAGIQRRVTLQENKSWADMQKEIAINFEAPVHLTTLMIPNLLKATNPCIANVTSGLSFAPLANVPVYCATKAALHSFTLSLRHQLRGTPVRVVEIIPPAVNTDLGGIGLHTFGVPLKDFADSVFSRFEQGQLEIAYGTAETRSRASRAELDAYFEQMNN